MQIIEQIKNILEPIARTKKCHVVDITYKRESGKFVLRIVLDKEGGITMDECAKLNVQLSDILEKENTIDDQYTLEVSSPGLDRRLKSDNDFTWAVGKKVKITTYVPIDGKNVFTGELLGLGEGIVVLEEEGTSWEIPREKIASAKLNLDIDWSKK